MTFRQFFRYTLAVQIITVIKVINNCKLKLLNSLPKVQFYKFQFNFGKVTFNHPQTTFEL